MKFIIIRHGNRFESPLYFTPLTKTGLEQADKLVDILPQVDIIYSSPFLRTLQTVYPYCIENDKTVNVENAFYESLDSDEFNYYNYKHTHTELYKLYPHLASIINTDYKSGLFVCNISSQEIPEKIKNRVFPFIYKLCQKYKNSDTVVLIVTHGTICNVIKQFFNPDIMLGEYVEEAAPFIIDVPADIKGPVGCS
jgi:broad specificity phosphatase PhoE